QVVALSILTADRGGRRDDLHAYRPTVRALPSGETGLDAGKETLVVAAERAQVFADHVQLIDDLQRRGGGVQRTPQPDHIILRVPGQRSLVAFASAAESVLRALAVDIAEQRAESVRQTDRGQLVQGADDDRGQIAVDLGIDDMQGKFLTTVRAPVNQPYIHGV